ncbi:MAG TPA: cob(I)yrinic acid a,c-diamide adenosyltransferase [Polyangiaceae bacterium]|nr:cob(I)yrinic acid a,c-diamide adenosyltransferase [Polyangiaceae bacterium]
MKIYTKTGDGGQTGLFGGARVRKDDPRVEAYGSVDELNASLGVVRAWDPMPRIEGILARVQAELFTLGAELSCQPGHVQRLRMPLLNATHVRELERNIDECERDLPELTTFVLPTGARAGAALHLARTICRRCERRVLSLETSEPATQPATQETTSAETNRPETSATSAPQRPEIVIYLNRLSDLLFVLARLQNHHDETPETPWSAKHSV